MFSDEPCGFLFCGGDDEEVSNDRPAATLGQAEILGEHMAKSALSVRIDKRLS